MNFDLKKFYKFCSELKIETKEEGLKKMGNLLGTQTYVMQEIQKGLDEDVHFFVILKGRQLVLQPFRLRLIYIGSSHTLAGKAHLWQIRKKTGICSEVPLECTLRVYRKNIRYL